MSKIRFFTIIVLLLASGIYWIFAGKKTYPLPTSAYYVNDYADVLMMATRSSIAREGERLYSVTEDTELGGTQVVFATFKVENLTEIADYDKTDIYREWKIGENDMGVLVLFFFEENSTEEPQLVETQIEVGYRMEEFLTPAELGRMVDSSINNEDYNWLLDLSVANLLYQILEEIYVEAYDYESFNYDMDSYYDYLLDYEIDEVYDTEPMSLFDYFFSYNAFITDQLFFFVPIASFVLFGGYGIFRAGGGKSGGMGVFRRRR